MKVTITASSTTSASVAARVSLSPGLAVTEVSGPKKGRGRLPRLAPGTILIKRPLMMSYEPIALDVKLFGETDASVIKRELEALDSSVCVDVVSNWYQDKRLYVYVSPSAYDRFFRRSTMPYKIARAIEHLERTAPRYRGH